MGGVTPGGMPGMGMAGMGMAGMPGMGMAGMPGMGMAGMPGMGMGGFGAMPAPGLDAIGAGASEAVVQEIARRVRALSRAQRTQWGGSWSLERVFEMYDIGRRGAIQASEFQAALNGIGLVLSRQELDVRMAFDLAGPSGSGFVSAREFR